MSIHTWARDLALDRCPNFVRDPQFGLALLAGALYWGWLAGGTRLGPPLAWTTLGYLALLLPLLEEALFRGAVQGRMLASRWGRRRVGPASLANLATSLLFVAAHVLTRPWSAALPVVLPSLLFGYFRERHRSTWPAVALHAIYNAGFFIVTRGVAPAVDGGVAGLG